MQRRNFFAILFGTLLAKWLPKPKIKHRYGPMWNVCGGDLGHDCIKMGCENRADVVLRDGYEPGLPVSGIQHYYTYGISYYQKHPTAEAFQNLKRF